MARILPTYSTKPPAHHNEFNGINRQQRRFRARHHSLFTRKTVWHPWHHLPLNEAGVLVRVKRIAKRRGKSATWISKRFNKDLRALKYYGQVQAARLQELFEQNMEEHNHEHREEGTTGTDPGSTDGE